MKISKGGKRKYYQTIVSTPSWTHFYVEMTQNEKNSQDIKAVERKRICVQKQHFHKNVDQNIEFLHRTLPQIDQELPKGLPSLQGQKIDSHFPIDHVCMDIPEEVNQSIKESSFMGLPSLELKKKPITMFSLCEQRPLEIPQGSLKFHNPSE